MGKHDGKQQLLQGSRGIGLATAKRLADEGAFVSFYPLIYKRKIAFTMVV